MKISAAWMHQPGTVSVMQMLEGGGHKAYFVGGCVRNTALNLAVTDIDISTDARPERVMELAAEAGLKAVGTGIDHGTVTVVADHIPHEITTFRRDVETDGRRAVVAFSDRVEDDAQRRDFTINALYAGSDGMVIDPTGDGLSDLAAKRLRFIGSPADRIREDYLRILRFFRFHAWYAEPGFDPEAIGAISSLSGGLETISKERIGQEVRKLLAAREAAPSLATMAQTGVMATVLPGANPATEAVLEALEAQIGANPSWLRRLAALGGEDTAENLRLSKSETRDLALRRDAIGSARSAGELGYRLGLDTAFDVLLLRGATFEMPPTQEDFGAARIGADATFPVRAGDLMPDFTGPALGAKLAELETRWIDSGFTLTREALLA